MNKIKYLVLAILIGLNVRLWAADADQGAVQNNAICRWQSNKVGPSSATVGILATSNVVQSTSAILGKIIIVPGATTDTVVIHNSATVAGVGPTTDLFKYTATSAVVGLPVVFDLLPGFSYTSGITIVSTIAASSTTLSVYVDTDKAQ